MARKLAIVFLFLIVGSGAIVAQDDKPEETPSPVPEDLPSVCRDAVDGMSALTADLELPDRLMQENPVRSEGDFDVTAYFDVLDHLAVQDSYVLDYVYHYDGMGGYPVLYARPADEEQSGASTENYLDSIEIDDTPEGYLQYVTLDVMGGQSYLFWHANYNDHRIVCDGEALETILTSPNDFGNFLSDGVIEQARALDVEPLVVFDDETVRVQVLLFTKWGGFSRATFTISRDFPHQIEAVKSETLVPYDCGVMF